VTDDALVIRRATPALFVLALVLLTWGIAVVVDGSNDADYTDLVVAVQQQAAADGEHVATLPSHTADRWFDNGGPSWSAAQDFTGSGNSQLASVFGVLRAVERQREGHSTSAFPNLECLYWPVVPHEGDGITNTTSMLQMCYQSSRPEARPYATIGMSVRYD